MNRRLLIFLKYPAAGTVKTRLAAALGEHAAAALYRLCAELTLERLRPLLEEATLYLDPPDALDRASAWLGPAWMVRPQRGRTLGERLIHATGEAFAAGARRVVVIGTDSPWLRPAQIDAAFGALDEAQLVVGPTDDGGYYAIGLSQPAPALFEQVAWSSSRVFAQTLERASALGLCVRVLDRGYDLDYAGDVERFLEEERRHAPVSQTVHAIAHLLNEAVGSRL